MQQSLLSSGLVQQTASLSHSHSFPCRQSNSSIHSWPTASPYSPSRAESSSCALPPGSRAPARPPWHGRRLEANRGGGGGQQEADVVCESFLRHQNVIPEHSLKSPADLWCLLPHPAPPPTSRNAALPGNRPVPQIQAPISSSLQKEPQQAWG